MSVRLDRSGLRWREVVHGLSTFMELPRGRKFLALPAIAAMVLAPARVALAQSLAPVWGISTVAGTGATTGVDTGDGNPAVSATIGKPYQVVVDAVGNIYFGEPSNNVVRKVDVNGIISTVAGTGKSGFSGDGGPAASATLNGPEGVSIDNHGNLLIGDAGNYVIRKVDLVSGIITTIVGQGGKTGNTGDNGPATSATLGEPFTVICDPQGNLYIADYNKQVIRKVDTSGIIHTIAGTGSSGYSGNGGPATSAKLSNPFGPWLDVAGNLYFSDSGNDVVRMIDTSGNMHTVAGGASANPAAGATCPGNAATSTDKYGDGCLATKVVLKSPRTPVGDNLGNIYIPDESDEAVRVISPNGVISTIGGTDGTHGFAGDGGPATTAKLDSLYGLSMDSSNNLFVADASNYAVRRMSFNTGFPVTGVNGSTVQNLFLQSTSAVTPSAATITPSSEFAVGALSGCSLGASLAANTPCTFPITFRPVAPGLQAAQLAITNADGNISTIGLSGVGVAPQAGFSLAALSTVAGNGTAGNTTGEVSDPRGGVIDSAGNIYFADSGNNAIRRIDAVTGALSTVAGMGAAGYAGDGAAATSAQLNAPAKVVVDAAGDLYIADTGNNVIRYVAANTGVISTIAGTGTASYTGDGGLATAATLNHPQGLAVDLGGHVYVADTGNHVIRYFGNGSLITTLTGTGTAGYTGDGNTAYGAALNAPQAVVLDQSGNVYIADTGNDVVRVISAAHLISTLAGEQGQTTNTGDGGAATSATLNTPSDIALDAAGDVYIAASGQVRVVNKAGVISTLAGTGAAGSYSGDGGAATSAVIPAPASNLMLDSAGDIVIAATAANRVLKVAASTPMPLDFGVQPAGTTGTATTLSVENTGNSTLSISSIAATAGFTLQTGGTSACTATTSLTPGQACTVSILFSPDSSADGAVSGTLTLTDNALNVSGATQVFQLTGSTKVIHTTTTAINTTPAQLVYGVPATVAATISNSSAATGTVNFSVNGTSLGSPQINNGVAMIALPNLSAGAASITAAYSGDANNGSSTGTANVTVQPALLTVKANSTTVQQTVAFPVFSATITGFVNGDTSSIVTGVSSVTTTATPSSPQGAYPLTVAQGTLAAPNYSFSFVNGTLTIGPPPTPDFSITVTPTAHTIPAGQVDTATITLSPLYGYKGSVQISCSSAPIGVGCQTAGPLSANPAGSDSWAEVNIISTPANTASNADSKQQNLWWALGIPMLFFGLARSRRKGFPLKLLSLILLASFTAGITSCSGGGTVAAAKTGTYQVTMTATDTSSKLSHSTLFTLTVQ
jgi:sugar lactone lactonase YvrE